MRREMDRLTEISSGFRVHDYHQVRPTLHANNPGTAAWTRVIAAFEARMSERFLDPIAVLATTSVTQPRMRPGFAIMALNCLVIDSLQSFREGRTATNAASTAAAFKMFFNTSPSFTIFNSNDRNDFVNGVRNALLHNGETRYDWKIRRTGSQILTRDKKTGSRILNYNLFHAAVVSEYHAYVRELNSDDAAIRARFLARMDALCQWPERPG
jgi:hypothetical protein